MQITISCISKVERQVLHDVSTIILVLILCDNRSRPNAAAAGCYTTETLCSLKYAAGQLLQLTFTVSGIQNKNQTHFI